MNVSEIFPSIQGEGKYAGYPGLFIRLGGCTRECDFCDSHYHIVNENMSITEIYYDIEESEKEIIIWTGGEPTLQMDEIVKVINITKNKKHHLETNGDIICNYDLFDYVCFSPKTLNACKNVYRVVKNWPPEKYDIKIVTDLKINMDMIEYATMLMPLTSDYPMKNIEIDKDVWSYCTEKNIKFCLRQHYKVWGTKRQK